MPIIVLYFLLNNLNLFEVAILASIAAIIGLLLEIPAGAITDKYGKKSAMILVGFFSLGMMIFYFIGNSFEEFIIASIFLGLWSAFTSGAREALLFDTLVELKRKIEFKQIFGKTIFYSHIGNAVLLLAVPVIYSFDVKLPFLIGIIFSAAIIFLGTLIKEPRIETEKDHLYISSSIKEILSKKKILFILVLMMVSFASLFAFSEFKQPLLVIAGIDIIYFGVIYATIRALSGLGGMIPHKINKKKTAKIIDIIGVLLILFSFLFFFFNTGVTIITGILLISLSEGIIRVSMYDTLNNIISSANRTTILSIASVLQQAYKAVIVLIMGYLADLIGLTQMFFPATIIFIIAIFLTLIIFRNHASIILK